jgi:hypothetical protein
MQHHTSTIPARTGLLRSLWIDQTHKHRLVEVIQIVDHEFVRLQPVRDHHLRPPSYLESTDQLAGHDYRRVAL